MTAVLVVEDSALLRRLLEDGLRAHGLTDVESYADGPSFIGAYRAHRQAQRSPALLVLDVELPGGPDGFLVGRSLRALECQLGVTPAPILFFSSRMPDEASQAAVADCFPARYAVKTDGGLGLVAFEGVQLVRSLTGDSDRNNR